MKALVAGAGVIGTVYGAHLGCRGRAIPVLSHLVAVRSDQLSTASAQLTGLAGAPAVVFFGTNLGGRAAITVPFSGDVGLGTPAASLEAQK